MMPGRLAGCVAWRGEDWPSCQAARRSLRAFQASPRQFKSNVRGQPCLSACLRSVVSTDGQSAFADGPVACEQTGLVTTAILDQCCLNRWAIPRKCSDANAPVAERAKAEVHPIALSGCVCESAVASDFHRCHATARRRSSTPIKLMRSPAAHATQYRHQGDKRVRRFRTESGLGAAQEALLQLMQAASAAFIKKDAAARGEAACAMSRNRPEFSYPDGSAAWP